MNSEAEPAAAVPRRLYAIVDADACDARGLALLTVAEAVCRVAPRIVQLRAKERPARQVLEWLHQLRAWTRASGSLLFANDRADLAALAACDGVHVGQDDLPVDAIRRSFPELAIGVSTHSEVQFDAALAARPSYVALGPIFETPSKKKPEPTVGIELLERLAPRARLAGIPVVAIGGIDARRAPLVLEAADCVAVIGALLPESGAGASVDSLSAALRALRAEWRV